MAEDAPQRPRLVLKPRDETAAKKAEEERLAKSGKNPFGAAKPREVILANRTGKTEEEILKEAIKGERLRLRLTPGQQEEKEQLEALVTEVEQQLAAEEDEGARQGLQLLLQERQEAVDALIDKFAHASLEAAQKGEVMRPSERRQQQLLQQSGLSGGAGHAAGAGAAATGRPGSFNNNHNNSYGAAEGKPYHNNGYGDGGGGGGGGGGGRNKGGFGSRGGYTTPGEGYVKGGGFGEGGARGYQTRGDTASDRPHHNNYNNYHNNNGGGAWAGGEAPMGGGGKYNKEGTTYKEPGQHSGGSYGDRPRGGGGGGGGGGTRDRDRDRGTDLYLPGMGGMPAARDTTLASVEYTSPYSTHQDRF